MFHALRLSMVACCLVFFQTLPAHADDAPAAQQAAPSVPTPVASDAPVSEAVENAVVKVYTTVRYPDPYQPWTKQAPNEISGSGVVIEGHRILTNAHVVLYASQVQIQASQSGDKISAKVVAIAPGIDLAVLQLDDESFFKTHAPVRRASTLPEIKDAVFAYGFPTGGASLSITKGIVSRIEFATYSFPVSGLRIQVDAAINPGNSGGPAIAGDKMVGLAFSKLGGDTQNIGYIIPNEEIELFLKDIADGHYDGKPAMFEDMQTLENPALRSFLKLDRSVEGMVVHHPYKTDAAYPLKEWDVITRIGDAALNDQGEVKLRSDLRVSFRYMIQKVAKNNTIPLEISRNGKPMHVDLPLVTHLPRLIPDLKGEYPPYFIYGPLVFSKATLSFLAFANTKEMLSALNFIRSPLANRVADEPDPEREELVVICSPFFSSKLATGYSNPSGSVVKALNGTRVRSLAQFVTLLRDSKDDYITLDLDNRGGEGLVFPRAEIMAATDDILTDNGIRAQASPDMLAIWKGTVPGTK